MRGGSTNRGRGGGVVYQAARGGVTGGRGRGGNSGQRGVLNAGAQSFSPPGQAGVKRPREEGSVGGPQQGNGKRPRGGGPNN
jgi:nucleoprotein TPR